MPVLSIIIPTYNSSKTINRCLDSILCQSYSNYEILVMDGLSSDNTLELVKAYNDRRIQIYSGKDNGIYDAMNKGIALAKGEWLYFSG
ncbi:MAG: glycosyltransferase, partial [Bacteroidales bacterium]|nr:glycosyltransferase [Bacteroidales bacterium]